MAGTQKAVYQFHERETTAQMAADIVEREAGWISGTDIFMFKESSGDTKFLYAANNTISSDKVLVRAGSTMIGSSMSGNGEILRGTEWDSASGSSNFMLVGSRLSVGVFDAENLPFQIKQASSGVLANFETSGANTDPSVRFKNDAREYTVGMDGSGGITNDSFLIRDSFGGRRLLELGSNGDCYFGSTLFVDWATGYVGIGTNGPENQLHIQGSASSIGIALENDSNKTTISNTSSNEFTINHGGNVRFKMNSSGDVSFSNNYEPTDKVYIRVNGTDSEGIQLIGYANNAATIRASGTDSTGAIKLYSGGVVKTSINGDGNSYLNGGNFGLNNASPTYLLDCDGSARIVDDLVCSANGTVTNTLVTGTTKSTGLTLQKTVNEIGTATDLGGDSDLIIPTQKAVKGYVDSVVTSITMGSFWGTLTSTVDNSPGLVEWKKTTVDGTSTVDLYFPYISGSATGNFLGFTALPSGIRPLSIRYEPMWISPRGVSVVGTIQYSYGNMSYVAINTNGTFSIPHNDPYGTYSNYWPLDGNYRAIPRQSVSYLI